DVPNRRDHEVPGGVGELVQQGERQLAAVHDEAVRIALGRAAEEAVRLLVRVLDVLQSPGGPKRFRHRKCDVVESSLLFSAAETVTLRNGAWKVTRVPLSPERDASHRRDPAAADRFVGQNRLEGNRGGVARLQTPGGPPGPG